ncbi:hypothetical protein FHU38_000367 [Saccharomonospora amisosensis]|uniref:Uncharacterized protein n=1 Tax=Saccharomonospora amisosensis TaxID=1128677 RepID=A0A7X5UL66_9PSEU|nr:hypothetical protein [Saccharomonospora amisosensis]NIJ10023.1 hypothetical protein [Saccharomonospora amisosensis]
MEAWRILATILLGVPGILGVLLVIAKARERSGSAATAAVAGLVCATALAVGCVLTLTVLPAAVTWGVAATVAVGVAVALLVG